MGDLETNPTARGRVFRLDLFQPVSIFVAQQFGLQAAGRDLCHERAAVRVRQDPDLDLSDVLHHRYRQGYRPPHDNVLMALRALPGVFGRIRNGSSEEIQVGCHRVGDPGRLSPASGCGSCPAGRPAAPRTRPSPPAAADRPRLYRDAPEGTAVVAGDPSGGSVLVELRVKDGQKVKKGEIVAVLSNYARADVTLRMAEADLVKLQADARLRAQGHAALRYRPAGGRAQVLDRAEQARRPAAGALGQAARSARDRNLDRRAGARSGRRSGSRC